MNVRKAVVPIAGLGTRLFPASHACKKELFPVVGADGIARPLLHYQIMDLLDAGIEQICIIVRGGEERLVTDYLRGPGEPYLSRLQKYPDLAREVERMRAALDCLSFAVQETQEGYGHAVYQSKAFAAGEPVLLCLGDHLFRARHESCHSQLLRAYRVCGGRSVSAVNRIRGDQLKGYGTIAGQRWPTHPDLIEVSLIIEKPSLQVAREKLRVEGLGDDEFLGWFGMHVLAPSIYDVLEEMIAGDIRQQGEFQLTYAQELQRQREGYCALEIRDGRRFDFGTPQDYLRSAIEFARA
ncbi:MAG: sugar phosphate nucleotidyltransferase [Anaerolineae bacterium]|nr:sugar phosphate nucleotidyltransferase [Anaerolineae bacterium]